MKIKGIVEVDHVNYKKLSMFISFPKCTFKCDKECGASVCQNSALASAPEFEIDEKRICESYTKNPLTEAIVIGGMEPFDSGLDLLHLIDCLRRQYKCNDEVVIYTGYTEDELECGWRDFDGQLSKTRANFYQTLKEYGNIIIKFGRFVPDDTQHFDEVLGVTLASQNQYAKQLLSDWR